jgi:hypothetical protein
MTKITTDFNGSENATVRASRRKEIHDFWFGAGEAEAEGTFAGVRANINGIYDPDTANGEAFGSWLTKWNALNEPDKLLNDTLKYANPAAFILADNTARIFGPDGVTAVSAPGTAVSLAADDWEGIETGAQLVTGNATLPTGWSGNVTTGPWTKTAGTANSATWSIGTLVSGRAYVVEIVYDAITASTLTPRFTGGATVTGLARSAAGSYRQVIIATAAHTTLDLQATASTAAVVSSVSVREVLNWPAYQNTAAARPTYQERTVGPATRKVIAFDGSDDALLHQLAAGGTVSVALFGLGGSYLIPSITLAAPSVLQLGPLSVLDDGVLVSGCPRGILRAVGTNASSSAFDLVGYAIMKANPTAEEQARAMRYFAAFGARGWLVEGPELVTNGGFDTDSGWNFGSGWSFDTDAALKTAGSGGTGSVSRDITVSVGTPYLFEFEIKGFVASGAIPRFTGGTNVVGSTYAANGVHREILIAASGNTTVGVASTSSSSGLRIDNISVRALTPEF